MVTYRRDSRSPSGRNRSHYASFALVLLITGCSLPQISAEPAAVPPELTEPCPTAQPTPPAPPRVRTAELLAKAYDKTDVARAKDKAALQACSDKLSKLNDWIKGHPAK